MTAYISPENQTNARMCASALKVLEAHAVIEPPTNIYQILGAERVCVDFWPFNNGDLGGLYIRNVAGPAMAINANHPRTRQRFTAGHELKHHLHDIPEDGHLITSCYGESKKRIETRANSFAAELLVPSHMLREALQELGDELYSITTLATAFRVSYEVIVYRLNTLKLISNARKKRLLSAEERRKDASMAMKHKQSNPVAGLNTLALIGALGCLDVDQYCPQCSMQIIHDSWRICPDCCARLD